MNHNEKQLIECAKKMPPLSHWADKPKPWSGKSSDVVKWAASTEAGANVILQILINARAIRFDASTECWVGVNINITTQAPTATVDATRNIKKP